jgi:hypothetical protein
MSAYRGKVTQVTERGVYVQIPKHAPGIKQGPYGRPAGIELVPGDSVILLELEKDEDLVIVCKVAVDPESARAILLAEEPTEPYHVATKGYVDGP